MKAMNTKSTEKACQKKYWWITVEDSRYMYIFKKERLNSNLDKKMTALEKENIEKACKKKYWYTMVKGTCLLFLKGKYCIQILTEKLKALNMKKIKEVFPKEKMINKILYLYILNRNKLNWQSLSWNLYNLAFDAVMSEDINCKTRKFTKWNFANC